MGLFKGMKDSMAQAKEMQDAAAAQMGAGMPGMDASSASLMADANAMNASGAEMRRLWDEGIDSGRSADLDMTAIKKRGRQRLRASRK